MIELVGFAPDLDPAAPGIFLDCDGLYPTRKGFRATRAPLPQFPALDSTVLGAYRARYLDATELVFAGTATKLYSGAGNLWTDRSGAQVFTTPATSRWRFVNFGNDVLATNGADPVQIRTTGNFAVLGGGPPKAKIITTVGDFVFLLNTQFGENQWWCSALGNDADWVPDIATQSANARLTATYGDITAGHPQGSELLVYKRRSMYVGRYVGPPVIWDFQVLSTETGSYGQEAVVALADGHVFPGYNDFYTCSGDRPKPLVSPVREFFFQQSLDQNFAHRIIGRWDKLYNVVVWHYPSVDASPAGTLDKWIAWHVETGKWTLGNRVIEYAFTSDLPISVGTLYNQVGDLIATYNDAPTDRSYDTWLSESVFVGSQAIFKTDHVLYILNGEAEPSYFVTGDIGDDQRFTHLIRVKPKFAIYPQPSMLPLTYATLGACFANYGAFATGNITYGTLTTCNIQAPELTEMYKVNLGDTLAVGRTVPLAFQGWYNVRRSARFHRFKLTFPGEVEIVGLDPVMRDSGSR